MNSNIERLLSQILMVLGGTNAAGIPANILQNDKSIGHAYSQAQRDGYRDSITSPMADSILNLAGAKVYENSLRLLGYSNEAAYKQAHLSKDTGAILARTLSRVWVDQQAGNDIRHYTNETYKSMHLWHNDPHDLRTMRNSFRRAGNNIFRGVSSGELGAYSLGEAYQFAGALVSTGKYNAQFAENLDKPTDNNRHKAAQRVNAIKEDLKRYASGISDLKDALDGPLDEVLKSFEALAGSGAATMSKARFSSLAKALYQTTVYGGASQELVARAIATQNAYMQGTGAGQATAMAAGTLNANIIAKGIRVEGASADSMAEALNKRNRNMVASGRTRELAAAYAFWAETSNKEMNQDNFKEFLSTQLNGNASAGNVREYLNRQQVTGTYINSEYVQRAMGHAEVHEGLLKSEIYDKYQQQFKQNLLERSEFRSMGLIQEEDKALTPAQLRDKVKQRAIAALTKSEESKPEHERKSESQIVREAVQHANTAERFMSEIITTVVPEASSIADGVNIIQNAGATLKDRSQYKDVPFDTYTNELSRTQSIHGMAGVFTKMIQHDAGVATVGKILRGAYGVTTGPALEDALNKIKNDEKATPEDKQKRIETVLNKVAKGKEQEFVEQGAKNVKTFTAMDAKLLDSTVNDKGENIDDETEWRAGNWHVFHGNYKQYFENTVNAAQRLRNNNYKHKSHRNGDIAMLKEGLELAVEKGKLTEEQAFVYEQEATDKNWNLLDDKSKQSIVKAYTVAKAMGYDKEEAEDIAGITKTIKSTASGSKQNSEARKELMEQIMDSDAFKTKYKDIDDTGSKKILARQQAEALLGEKTGASSTETMLAKIMTDVMRIADK